ncbi:MAG: hypothetical protein RL577_816 [Bacteroidota bacterium]
MVALSSKWLPMPAYLYFLFKAYKRWGKSFWLPILLCGLAVGLSDSISSKLFKPNFKRLRPCFEESLSVRTPAGLPGGQYGFVSSHASNAAALYWLMPLVLGLSLRERYAWLTLAALIALSRVYLGVHYPSDIIAGALLGWGIAYVVFRIRPSVWTPNNLQS